MQTDDNRAVGLGVRLPIESGEQFIEKFGASLSRGGIFLRSKKVVPPGTLVQLDLKLANGQPLIRSRGKVEFVTGQGGIGASGMGIRFLDIDPESLPFLEQALARVPGRDLDAPPLPPGVGPVQYGVLPTETQPAGATALSLTAAAPLLTSTAFETKESLEAEVRAGSTLPYGAQAVKKKQVETAPVVAPVKVEAEKPAPAPPSPSAKPVLSEVEGLSARQPVAFDSAQADRFLSLSRELRSLRRQMYVTWVIALLAIAGAFAAGWKLRPQPTPAPVQVAQAPAKTVEPAKPPPNVAPEDLAPATEDEQLTPDEQANSQEVLEAATSPVPDATKTPKKNSRKAAHGTLVASAGSRSDGVSVERANEAERRLIAEGMGSRGASCKSRFDAITKMIDHTRVPSHREAGIVLRARCYADTWRVDQAKAEFRRYLKEYPHGRFADEAKRVLAN